MKNWNELMDERGTRTDMPMKPQVVDLPAQQAADDDAIIVCRQRHGDDLGGALHRDARRHEFSASGHAGDDGATDCPTASAAAVAYPGRQVVCMSATAASPC